MFRDLPDKNDYPDYYMIISQPICMQQIKRKITKKEYQSPRQFFADVRLLCDNCRLYNEDGSVLFKDANLIEETTVQRLREGWRPRTRSWHARWRRRSPRAGAAGASRARACWRAALARRWRWALGIGEGETMASGCGLGQRGLHLHREFASMLFGRNGVGLPAFSLSRVGIAL